MIQVYDIYQGVWRMGPTSPKLVTDGPGSRLERTDRWLSVPAGHENQHINLYRQTNHPPLHPCPPSRGTPVGGLNPGKGEGWVTVSGTMSRQTEKIWVSFDTDMFGALVQNGLYLLYQDLLGSYPRKIPMSKRWHTGPRCQEDTGRPQVGG